MTRSAAFCLLVNGVDDGREKLLTVAAAAVRMLLSNSWSGSGSDLGFGGVYHFSILGVGGAQGGHGVGHGRPVDFVGGESGDVAVVLDSCSRPSSYSSCAAGGRLCWRYHDSLNVA